MSRFSFFILTIGCLLSNGCQWVPALPLQPPTPSAAPTVTRPAGGRIYVTDKDSRVVGIRTDQNTVAEQFPVEEGAGGVVVSPDDTLLYASARTKDYVRIFQTNGTPVGRIPTGKEPAGLAMASDGSRIYVANKASASISVIDPAQRKQIDLLRTGPEPVTVALSPDSATLYVLTHGDSQVTAYDCSSGKQKGQLKVPMDPFGVAVDPSGKYVYVTSFAANEVWVLDAASLNRVAVVAVGDGAYDVVASKDGQVHVSCVEDGSVVTFQRDAWKGEPHATPVGARPTGLALSPDQKALYIALEGDARIAVHDIPTLHAHPPLDLGVIPIGVFCGR